MSDDVAIKVEHVSKEFRLPHEKQTSIKGALINLARSGRRKRTYERQRVLKDISFEIRKGEFFGIVGRNGSGKSTLLKMLAGIYQPTKGHIQVNGKLTPFIELGVGFNPELTGRENVFLNGALLGFSHKEMEAMYDSIVDFAEIKKFMDQKLKNYSSGMQVRLAFSIAIPARTPILLLDEVLAVGDEAFQQKCIKIFEEYKAQKQTLILVTHDMGTVKRYCTRAMLLNAGEIATIGDPDMVANEYAVLNNLALSENLHKKASETNENKLLKSKIAGSSVIQHGDEIELVLDWSAVKGAVENVGVAVYKNSGEYILGVNTILEKINVKNRTGLHYQLRADMGPGGYHFKIGLFGATDRDIVEFIDEGPEFLVRSSEPLSWKGITNLEHSWKVKNV